MVPKGPGDRALRVSGLLCFPSSWGFPSSGRLRALGVCSGRFRALTVSSEGLIVCRQRRLLTRARPGSCGPAWPRQIHPGRVDLHSLAACGGELVRPGGARPSRRLWRHRSWACPTGWRPWRRCARARGPCFGAFRALTVSSEGLFVCGRAGSSRVRGRALAARPGRGKSTLAGWICIRWPPAAASVYGRAEPGRLVAFGDIGAGLSYRVSPETAQHPPHGRCPARPAGSDLPAHMSGPKGRCAMQMRPTKGAFARRVGPQEADSTLDAISFSALLGNVQSSGPEARKRSEPGNAEARNPPKLEAPKLGKPRSTECPEARNARSSRPRSSECPEAWNAHLRASRRRVRGALVTPWATIETHTTTTTVHITTSPSRADRIPEPRAAAA